MIIWRTIFHNDCEGGASEGTNEEMVSDSLLLVGFFSFRGHSILKTSFLCCPIIIKTHQWTCQFTWQVGQIVYYPVLKIWWRLQLEAKKSENVDSIEAKTMSGPLGTLSSKQVNHYSGFVVLRPKLISVINPRILRPSTDPVGIMCLWSMIRENDKFVRCKFVSGYLGFNRMLKAWKTSFKIDNHNYNSLEA